MPRPAPATSSSDSDANSEQSITDEVDLVVGDLYSSEVVQHLERPRLLSFSNTFDDLELRCICRTGKCRYSWPQRVHQRPLYAYETQTTESSPTEDRKPQTKNKNENRKQNIVFSTLRSIVSSTSGRKSGKSVKEVSGDDKHCSDKSENVAKETTASDSESDTESASATCDLTIPFQSYVDTLKLSSALNKNITSSSSSSDSDAISTDNYSDDEFRRIAEAGRAANLTELELAEVITPSPIVRLVWMEANVASCCAATTAAVISSKSTKEATNETTAKQTSSKTKSKKRSKSKTSMLSKALNLKINKPKFLTTSKKGRISSNSRQPKNSQHKSHGTTDHTTATPTCTPPTCSTTPNTVTPPTKPDAKKDLLSPGCSSKQEQIIAHSSTKHHVVHNDDSQKDTHFDKRELFLTGASNIHDLVVHDTSSSGSLYRQRSKSISSDDSKSTDSEVEEDEVRSIAHDLRSLQIISTDNLIRLIGFGKLGEEKRSYANEKLSLSKLSKRRPMQNKNYAGENVSNDAKNKEVIENKYPYDDYDERTTYKSRDDSDVNTSDSDTDSEEGWRAVYDFTKPLCRDFTPKWSSDSTSTDPNTSDNSDIFSSDDDNLDINDNYNVLQLNRSEGLTKSEKLGEKVSIRLIGFSSIR